MAIPLHLSITMNMKLHCLLCLLLSASLVLAEDSKQDIKSHKEAAATDTPQMIFSNYEDLKWNKILPDLGENSPEICILRLPSHANTCVPRITVWVSLALCQCLRT